MHQEENKKFEEALELILYKDTFFDSQLTIFNQEQGNCFSTKEINEFMAKSLRKMIPK
jgi:hypothetical protein